MLWAHESTISISTHIKEADIGNQQWIVYKVGLLGEEGSARPASFQTKTNKKLRLWKQDQVHLASRTHFVDLVIHDICSLKIIPYFADLVIHNICSQKIMPYFFDKLSTSIRNFAQWASTFCFSFLNCFRFWVKFLFGKKFLGENFFG